MDIKKYYKDFDSEKVFEDKDEITVLRTVFYLETGVIVFVDCLEDKSKDDIKNKINVSDRIKIIDEFTEENKRIININKERTLLIEQEEEFRLTKENFGIGVEKQDQ